MSQREGYKKTKIGWIPEDWDVVKQGDVSTLYNGRAYKLSEWEKSGIPVIRLQNLTGSGTEYYYSNMTLPDKQYTNKGDLLYMWSATFGPYIWEGEKAIYHYHIWKINHDLKKFDKIFHFYLLDVITQRMKNQSNGSTMLHVTKSGMEKLLIPLPPLPEQKKIASIFTNVDDKISSIEDQIQQTEQFKKGLMEKLLTEGIGHTEFKDTKIGGIPKGWNLAFLEDITRKKILDGTHFTPNYSRDGVPFLRVTDIKEGEINFDKIKYIPREEHNALIKRCLPEKGDILYSKNGTIGISKIINWDWEFSIFVSLALIKPDDSLIINNFLKYLLDSKYARREIKIRAKQGAVTNLHLEEIRKFRMPLPPLEEQKEITSILSTVDNKIEVLTQKKSQYQTLKKGLSQQLLTGQMRVKV